MIETAGGAEIITAGPRGAKIRTGVGPTSGVVVGEDGFVISSAFNFANKPSSIHVSIAGHKDRYVAKLVATDQTRMLSLLKITPKEKLVVPGFVKKETLKVGQTAIAVGRTLAGDVQQPPSVSVGIISATDRIWGKAIQSDAKISPTNYGGPMIDLQGNVQGILVPASPRSEGETAGLEWYDSGIGFAVPLEDVFAVLPHVEAGGKDLKNGIVGVNMKSGDEFSVAPEVGSVLPGSAAEKGGIKAGDVVKSIDGKEVANFAQMRHRLGTKYEGDSVSLVVLRDGKEEKINNLVLGSAATASGQGFLGIVPMRDDLEAGVQIRYVYPKSAADVAKLQAGDRIMKIGLSPAPSRTLPRCSRSRTAISFSTMLQATSATTEIKLEAKQKDKTNTITPGSAPRRTPCAREKLPVKATLGAALGKAKKDDEKKDDKKDEEKKGPETGFIKRTTAAADRNFWLYVPSDYEHPEHRLHASSSSGCIQPGRMLEKRMWLPSLTCGRISASTIT